MTVSPELVLVDPTLAPLRESWSPDRSVAPSQRRPPPPLEIVASYVPEPMVSTRSGSVRRRRPARLVLTGLALAGVVSGTLLLATGERPAGEERATSIPTPSGSSPSRATIPAAAPYHEPATDLAAAGPGRPSKPKPNEQVSRSIAGVTRVMVERKLLALLVIAPASKLPPQLIDARTGLAKDNLQAICRPEVRSFSCLVRPLNATPGEGLRVEYRPARGRTPVLAWQPYRGA